MNDDPDKQQSAANEAVERELRQGRKFTAKEAMARLAGPGAMKGASPISPLQQAEVEIGNWLRCNVHDDSGALQAVLHRHLKGSRPLLENVDRPLAALAEYCRRLLSSDPLLEELVREADVEWGQRMDERPHFERIASPPHPGDPYTVQSVRRTLEEMLQRLGDSNGIADAGSPIC